MITEKDFIRLKYSSDIKATAFWIISKNAIPIRKHAID